MNFPVRKYTSGYVRLIMAGACLALVSSLLAAPALANNGLALRDGVVIDAEKSVAYVMRPGGGIEAVDLKLGSVLWTSEAASRPLALVKGQLVAQADVAPGAGLKVVTLDPAARGAATTEATLPLPKGVRGGIDDGWRSSLKVQAVPAGDGVLIQWKAVEVLPRAVAPDEEATVAPTVGATAGPTERRSPVRTTEGAARFDVATGAMTNAPVDKNAVVGVAGLRELRGGDRLAGVEGRQFLSSDGQHVLASRPNPANDPMARHDWQVYGRASGQALGGFASSVSAAPFLVVKDQVIVEARPQVRATGDAARPYERTELSLRSMDLLNGVEVWKVAVRNIAFEGPFPP